GPRGPVVLRALRRLPGDDRALPATARRHRSHLSAVPRHDAAVGGGQPDRRPTGRPPLAGQRHAVAIVLTDAGRALRDKADAISEEIICALDLDRDEFRDLKAKLNLVTERVTTN